LKPKEIALDDYGESLRREINNAQKSRSQREYDTRKLWGEKHWILEKFRTAPTAPGKPLVFTGQPPLQLASIAVPQHADTPTTVRVVVANAMRNRGVFEADIIPRLANIPANISSDDDHFESALEDQEDDNDDGGEENTSEEGINQRSMLSRAIAGTFNAAGKAARNTIKYVTNRRNSPQVPAQVTTEPESSDYSDRFDLLF
jgi:hypothetical protein